ncbi:hypothetical protein [Pantoea agglomerans]|uniref:hypothetical protein n=1 Tax=Enterobacter agglomerans TaxID=549 RepID=UPI0030EF4D74
MPDYNLIKKGPPVKRAALFISAAVIKPVWLSSASMTFSSQVDFRVIFKARQNRSQRDLLSTQKKATPLSQRGPYHSA